MEGVGGFEVFLESAHQYNDYEVKFNDSMSGKCPVLNYFKSSYFIPATFFCLLLFRALILLSYAFLPLIPIPEFTIKNMHHSYPTRTFKLLYQTKHIKSSNHNQLNQLTRPNEIRHIPTYSCIWLHRKVRKCYQD